MKTIIVLISLFFAMPAWAGDYTTSGGPIYDDPESGLSRIGVMGYKPPMTQTGIGHYNNINPEFYWHHPIFVHPEQIKQKKGYWEVKVLQEGKLNDFLKANPEWEPFAVSKKTIDVEYDRHGDSRNWTALFRKEEILHVYLKRWVQE